MKERQYLFIKYKLSSLLFERVEMPQVRDRETKTKDLNCYHWLHIFLTHVKILYSEPYFFFSTEGHCPQANVYSVYCFSLYDPCALWGLKLCAPDSKYYVIILSSHHLVMLLARISQTLSRHSSLLFIPSGRSSGLHPISSQSCCM